MSTHKAPWVVLEAHDTPLAVKILPVPIVTTGSALVRILYEELFSHLRDVFLGKPPYASKILYTPVRLHSIYTTSLLSEMFEDLAQDQSGTVVIECH